MAKFNLPLSTFQAGEIAPRLWGRVDVQQYLQSLRESRNGLVLPQGGHRRRGGSIYLRPVYDSPALEAALGYEDDIGTKHRLIPFRTTDGKYFLIICRATRVEGWSAIDTETGTVYELNPYVDANANVWSQAQVAEIHYAQNGDYLAIAQGDQRPLGILWDGLGFTCGVHWQIFSGTDGYEQAKRRAFLEPEVGNFNGRGSLTLSGTTLTASEPIFRSSHVGSAFKLSSGSSTCVVIVTAYTSGTQVTVSILYGTAPAGAVGILTNTSWEEEAWNGVRGYPRTVTFFEGRLIYGGTRTHPNRIWMSQIGDVDELMYRPLEQDGDFATYTEDNSRAWYFDYATGEPNQIRWLSSGKKLFIGASSREYYASGIQGAMGQRNIDVKAATAYGSDKVQPVRQATSVAFVQRGGARIRDLQFSYDEEDYKSQDLTKLAEHITRRSLEKWPYTAGIPTFTQVQMVSSPFPVMWAIDTAGGLFSATLDKDSGILAWSHHQLGGKTLMDGTEYPPKVSAIATMESPSGFHDDLWMLVRRRINGEEKLYLERIGRGFEAIEYVNESSNIDDKLVYGDCTGLSRQVTATTTHLFDHLKGETVEVVADGFYLGDQTIDADGTLTLVAAAREVIVGLSYTSRLETVGIDAGSQIGTAKGQPKRAHELVVGFHKTLGARVGTIQEGMTEADLQELPTSIFETASDGTYRLFTGEHRFHLPGYGRDYRLVVEQTKMLPCEVSYLVAEGQSYD